MEKAGKDLGESHEDATRKLEEAWSKVGESWEITGRSECPVIGKVTTVVCEIGRRGGRGG